MLQCQGESLFTLDNEIDIKRRHLSALVVINLMHKHLALVYVINFAYV